MKDSWERGKNKKIQKNQLSQVTITVFFRKTPPPFFFPPWPQRMKVLDLASKEALLAVMKKVMSYPPLMASLRLTVKDFFIETIERQLYRINMRQRQTTAAQMDGIVPGHYTFLATLKKRRGSFKGVIMTWSIFNFKSPQGSFLEEYGTVGPGCFGPIGTSAFWLLYWRSVITR